MARTTRDYSTAKQYLAKVLPWPENGDPPAWIGVTFKSKAPDDKKFLWSTRGVTSVGEAINLINWLLGLAGTRDIYVCMGSLNKAEVITSKRGFKYTKAERNQDHVVGLKSLYIDLDAKGGTDSYDTVEHAVTALFKFLKAARFPAPSVMVRTGGGVHVYWTLERILTPVEWLPLAEALKNAAKSHGIMFDAGCTTDSARILRVPCTFNHKFDPPRDVELVGDVLDFDYSFNRIEHALEPYKVAVRVPANKHIENPSLFKSNLPALQQDDLSAGIEQIELPKPTLKQLAKACPFVRDACQTGGAAYNEPLWYDTVQLATWTVEGEISAHIMGDKHPGYDAHSTSEKYEQAIDAQSAKSLGWLQCQTIARDGSKPCKTCPHLQSGKSPLNFVTFKSTQFNGVAYASSVGGMKAIMAGNIDLPQGYNRDAAGYISQAVTDQNTGTTRHVQICNYILVDPFINESEKDVTLNFTTSTRVGMNKPVQIQAANISQQEMRRELQTIGMMMKNSQVKPMGEFLVAWMQRLQQLKEAVLSTEPFGWSLIGPKVEGFAYGGTLYTPSGSRLAPLTDHSLAMQYTPTGSLQPWHDAMQMLLAQKRTALDVVLAASFAAPLVRSTGQPGLLMSLYSLESGIGKTTAMKVGQAVWGDPVKAMQGLNDTQNAVLGKLGRLRSLPMFWDELKTEDDAEKLVNLFFTITRGSEKLRMKATTELRASGSWETLLVSASNESMVDYIIGKTRMTTAGIYRLFEFTVPPGSDGRIAVSDASRMVSAMNTNFGVAGQIYSQFLGTNFQRIDDEVAAEMVTVGDAVKVRPDERFWSALVAIVTLGARYANELGLATFDYDKLQEFMADQFFAMRKLKSEQSVDMTRGNNVANILVQFLRDHRGAASPRSAASRSLATPAG
jgi:hypothetical protein